MRTLWANTFSGNMDIIIPADVKNYIENVFRDCNNRVARKISQNPNTWETSLDLTLIEHISNYSVPVRLGSNWVIRIDTHYLGGMRHWRNWEVADIGILLFFRKNGKTVKSKVTLLQSKRLYANEIEFEEDEKINYEIGFGRLYRSDESFNELLKPRTFHFDNDSRYKALKLKDEQCKAIAEYQKRQGIPIHYLFYNPNTLPEATDVPTTKEFSNKTNEIGCRIVPAEDLFKTFKKEKENHSPSYGELKFLLDSPFSEDAHAGGWRLEYFMSDLFINCKQGYIVKDDKDEIMYQLFNARSGPIAAALSVTFDIGG